MKNGDAPPLMDIFEIKGIGAWLAPKNRADMLRTALLGALILPILLVTDQELIAIVAR